MVTVDSSLNRRDFLAASAALGCTLATVPEAPPDRAVAPRVQDQPNSDASLDDNVYTRLLGVRPHLGAHEHISRLGGGRMSREVLNAMAEANDYFVDM
ncbi:MAG: twin-arginine translocation signal domain-containing protein, partial [Gemmatimonadaceae bacterium]